MSPRVLVGLLFVLLFAAQAHAQVGEPPLTPGDPSQPWVRSGSIYLGLAGVSGAVAAGLMPEQAHSWQRGIGAGHALWAASYTLDGLFRLINARFVARRAAGAKGPDRMVMASNRPWVLWLNLCTLAAVFAGGTVLAAIPDASHATRGFGATLAAHGSWQLSFAIVQLVKARRGRIPWMAQGLTTHSF